ncbi:MAG: hypothetical protein LBQ50_03810 [Planctomycetaceae bacterium]|jgi:guanyl-specific ribonuclease Sa|nr:hypothetical protein [Planctomycetaceae bacterium]
MAGGKGFFGSLKSVAGDAWGAIKGAGTSIKNWWKGTPKPVTTNITSEVQTTLDRIKNGVKFPHRNDGAVFQNREGILPTQPSGYYREYVYPTQGTTGPGTKRIIIGANGDIWLTLDHYRTFIQLQ